LALRVDVDDEAIVVTLDVVDREPGELATFESAGELRCYIKNRFLNGIR
jgi:hypothetical protein